MSNSKPPTTADGYHVGIICALDSELAAVEGMLDEEYDVTIVKGAQDINSYSFGRMQDHNVVIACLPAGTDGLEAAAIVASNIMRTFTQLRFGLLVGIGGGLPNLQSGIDIRLGDVVVSHPSGSNGGVVQYDKGKSTTGGGWEPKGTQNMPPTVLLAAVQKLKAKHRRSRSKVAAYVAEMLTRYPDMSLSYTSPGNEKDILFSGDCGCKNAEDRLKALHANHEIDRPARVLTDPKIHYGIIASGNRVIKDATARDHIRDVCGAVCVEMEAAGLMNQFPCLVIRGICDYADSHKNDEWHEYAAATAAAFAKELLLYVPPVEVEQSIRVQDLIEAFADHMQHTREHHQRQDLQYRSDQDRNCHQAFKITSYEELKNINEKPEPGTMKWAYNHEVYREWESNLGNDLIWISADPGCGKSVLSRWLVDHHLRDRSQNTDLSICYFFFKDNDIQSELSSALCALLHQLFEHQPQLISYAREDWMRDGIQIRGEKMKLWNILLSAARSPQAQPIVCVLDALDECSEGDQKELIRMLCDFHNSIEDSSQAGSLKFIVTSRPYQSIAYTFQERISALPSIHLRGEDEDEQIRDEIDIVLRARIQRMPLSDHIKDRITEKFLNMQHRTYLWLHLALESIPIILERSLRPDQETFETVPATVNAAYENVLSKVSDDLRATVRMILLVIVGAPRPLTVEEMALALGCAFPQQQPRSLSDIEVQSDGLGEKIRQWCGLFIFLNNGKLFLIHQTAKEFLLRDLTQHQPLPGQWQHCLSQQDVDVELSRIFMDYICLDEFDTLCPRLQDFYFRADASVLQLFRRNPSYLGKDIKFGHQVDFFWLAAQNWASHWRGAERAVSDRRTAQLLSLYDHESERFRRWSYAALPFLTRVRLSHRLYSHTALWLASLNGHHEMVRHFLKSCSHEDLRHSSGGIPLVAAATKGHSEIVQTLIEHGANAYNTVVEAFEVEKNALCMAALNGHKEVVRTLIDHGVSVNRSWQAGETALKSAIRGNHRDIIELLIEKGADVNQLVLKEHGDTALITAIHAEDESNAKFLIKLGADVNLTSPRRRSCPLRYARQRLHIISEHSSNLSEAEFKMEGIVKLLLRHGAEDAYEEEDGPVQATCEQCTAAQSKEGEGGVKSLTDQGNKRVWFEEEKGNDAVKANDSKRIRLTPRPAEPMTLD